MGAGENTILECEEARHQQGLSSVEWFCRWGRRYWWGGDGGDTGGDTGGEDGGDGYGDEGSISKARSEMALQLGDDNIYHNIISFLFFFI